MVVSIRCKFPTSTIIFHRITKQSISTETVIALIFELFAGFPPLQEKSKTTIPIWSSECIFDHHFHHVVDDWRI